MRRRNGSAASRLLYHSVFLPENCVVVMTKNRRSKLRSTLVLAALLSPAAAFAYVDPGSGMLLWQGLLAALGAVIVFVRSPLKVIKSLLDRLRGK